LIGVDTSVLVRYLVGTPPVQARKAAALIDAEDEIGISIVALLETAHVLRTQYGVARGDVVDTLLDLVNRENVTTLELSKADVLEALMSARMVTSAPIPDALIAAASRAGGAVPVYTFDRDFGRLGAPIAAP
jgi:predicted nucleic-acid-binding protein